MCPRWAGLYSAHSVSLQDLSCRFTTLSEVSGLAESTAPSRLCRRNPGTRGRVRGAGAKTPAAGITAVQPDERVEYDRERGKFPSAGERP